MITWWIERFSQTFMLVETHIGCYLRYTFNVMAYFLNKKIYISLREAEPTIFLQMSIHVLRFFNTSEK